MAVKTIGIIGGGVVGSAIARVWMEHAEVRVWDKEPERRTVHYQNEALICDGITFICLPESELEDFFAGIRHTYDPSPGLALSKMNFVIKSTCAIGTTRRMAEKIKCSVVVHSPEFLTSRCAVADAMCPTRNIIGVPYAKPTAAGGIQIPMLSIDQGDHISLYLDLLTARFPGVPVQVMCSDESEAVKLFQNAFFAVKVSAFNEFRTLADKQGLEWDRVLAGILADGRIAHSHTQVPGPDGKRGFGGSCLPKDLETLIGCFSNAFADMNTDNTCPLLVATYDRNKKDRKQ